MENTVIAELHISGYPVTVMESGEGDRFVAYDFPVPPHEMADTIERYLVNEGLLPTPQACPPPRTESLKIVVHFQNGTTEGFGLEHGADLLRFHEDSHVATIRFAGKTFELKDVAEVETPL